jgi:hypothetical protein
MGLALFKSETTRRDVEVAWATLRALTLAEAEDHNLESDPAHQLAVATAKRRFERLYSDWTYSK